MTLSIERRGFLLLTAAAVLPRAGWSAGKTAVAGLFDGDIKDGGFMQAGYSGLDRAARELGVAITYKDHVKPKPEEITAALHELVAGNPDLVIAHGGQNSAAAEAVAAEFPKTTFVVTQGGVTGANLSSYQVLQEQSAFLAGVLAARMTKTGTVGHMSGIRVKPGLKGRAAYAQGITYANPEVKLLTNFSGNQDDNALSKRVADAEIAAGADIIFTMLNAGRTGAIDACRAHGVRQIGNVVDWTKVDPEVFVASAYADSGMAVFNAVKDFVDGTYKPGVVREIGVNTPTAVRLTMGEGVTEAVRTEIADLTAKIASGEITISPNWSGTEFETPT